VETVLTNEIGVTHTRHTVADSSEIAAARRRASEMATRLGFDEIATGRLCLVVTEAATNILKHAGRGEILLRPVKSGARRGVEVLAIDSGPGMSNVAMNMVDGNSSTGTYGVGMGAMQRQADEFDLYSMPGKGCLLWLLVWDEAGFVDRRAWQVGAVSLPLPGETACGDQWIALERGDRMTLMVADGLGHGPQAEIAGLAAAAVVLDNPDIGAVEAIDLAHTALRGTRGAAVGVACIDSHAGVLEFAGIGNIAGSIEAGRRHHMVSHNGIVGNAMRKVQRFDTPWSDDALLVMHSDGIGTRWDLSSYPGLSACHPALVAAVLYRDFARGRDDATVVALRRAASHP
jgi:anti-sigma regulatory factor (Ser/Thr protein kinase)